MVKGENTPRREQGRDKGAEVECLFWKMVSVCYNSAKLRLLAPSE
jgi:hypothetical protein